MSFSFKLSDSQRALCFPNLVAIMASLLLCLNASPSTFSAVPSFPYPSAQSKKLIPLSSAMLTMLFAVSCAIDPHVTSIEASSDNPLNCCVPKHI